MKRNNSREQRIRDEIIVDAYGPEEQAMGWYYYLDRQLRFPFWPDVAKLARYRRYGSASA